MAKSKVIFRVRGNEKFWNTSIEALDLSQRAWGSLKRSKVDTLEDIANRWSKLGNIRNLGSNTEKEIRNKFINYYIENVANDSKIKMRNIIDDLSNVA